MERRARLLAGKLTERVAIVRDAVAPPGTRRPFTADKPRREVLEWWRKHIDDDLGKQVLAGLPPQDVMDLKVALAQHIEADPAYPDEDMDAGIDQPDQTPVGTTPMPSPPMGPPPMSPQAPPPQVPVGMQPPFAA